MRNTSDKFIFAFFVLLIIFPVLTLNFKQNTISESEGRYLANFPKFFDNNKSFNQNYGDELKNWCKDNFGFRKYFMKLCSITEYTIFNRAVSPKVIKGKNDWLFFTGENNLTILKGTYPNFDENELEEICEKQNKVKDYFASKGIEYIILLTPSKVSIYPEFIYENYYNPQNTPIDLLTDYLEKNSDIHVINTKTALLNKKASSDTLFFYKQDSHWNFYGHYVCYLELAKKLKKLNLLQKEPKEFNIYTSDDYMPDDLSIINNVIDILHENKQLISNLHSERDEDGDLIKKIYEKNPNVEYCYAIEDFDIDGPTILIYCDSMGPGVMHFLAENVKKTVCIQSNDMSLEIIDLVKPDCIIYQIGERRLDWLTELDDDFLESIS